MILRPAAARRPAGGSHPPSDAAHRRQAIGKNALPLAASVVRTYISLG